MGGGGETVAGGGGGDKARDDGGQETKSIVCLRRAQALDPHLRHGPRKLGHASGAGHSLPGASPLDPLVHMFDPSSGTHL